MYTHVYVGVSKPILTVFHEVTKLLVLHSAVLGPVVFHQTLYLITREMRMLTTAQRQTTDELREGFMEGMSKI